MKRKNRTYESTKTSFCVDEREDGDRWVRVDRDGSTIVIDSSGSPQLDPTHARALGHRLIAMADAADALEARR